VGPRSMNSLQSFRWPIAATVQSTPFAQCSSLLLLS
jgi:hypothetical protein